MAPSIAITNRIVILLASWIVGGISIYLAGKVLSDVDDFGNALIAAGVGAIVWAIFEPIPVLGTLLAPIAWIWVLNWRYPGGWIRAIMLGLVAWVMAIIVITLLSIANIVSLEALGVPGA
ncbi:MAG: hypothetical protein ABEI06_09710 [Halobacteriaceae archaeon]